MSDGLSGLVNRTIAWADGLQRKHGVLGFPYAVVKVYAGEVAAVRYARLWPRALEPVMTDPRVTSAGKNIP